MTRKDVPVSRQQVLLIAILMLTYILNVVDRQLVSVLAVPIKMELGLTDTAIGLLGGLAFAIFYTTLAVPAAWLADRWSRSWVISLSVGLWSAFTVLSGFAGNFAQFFAARVGVGVGEAGGVAPAHALISEAFPPQQRARAIGTYSLALPIGSAASLFLGGWIASEWGWRTAFIAIGLVGVALAPIVRLLVRDRREKPIPASVEKGPTKIRGAWGRIVSKPSFWLLAFGSGFGSMITYGITFWAPSYAARTLDLTLLQIAQYGGTMALVAGMVGIGLSSWLSDRLGNRNKAAYALVPAGAALLSIPLYIAAFSNLDLRFVIPLFFLPTVLSVAWLGPVLAAVQNTVPSSGRATASALFLLVNNLLGFVGGAVVFGAASDALGPTFGEDALRYALMFGLVFYLISAALLAAAARHLQKDWLQGGE